MTDNGHSVASTTSRAVSITSASVITGLNCLEQTSHRARYVDLIHQINITHASSVFTHYPRFLLWNVLADFPAMAACVGVKHADMLELLHEIEQDVRSNNILPDSFLVIDSGGSACLD